MITIGPISGAGPLTQSMATAASAMNTQSVRMRIAAENLTNAGSTAATPGGDPYQRRFMSFDQRLDRATGAHLVRSGRIAGDNAPFRTEYDPSHPAADERGYVKMPNISPLIEQADLRGAQLSYEASIAVMQQARSLYTKTLDILKG
jgi:flagellar basal-body rod protein FlgC